MSETPLDEGTASDMPHISGPADGALAAARIVRMAQLADYTARDLLALHGFGPKGLHILRAALAEHGLHLKGEAGEV